MSLDTTSPRRARIRVLLCFVLGAGVERSIPRDPCEGPSRPGGMASKNDGRSRRYETATGEWEHKERQLSRSSSHGDGCLSIQHQSRPSCVGEVVELLSRPYLLREGQSAAAIFSVNSFLQTHYLFLLLPLSLAMIIHYHYLLFSFPVCQNSRI